MPTEIDGAGRETEIETGRVRRMAEELRRVIVIEEPCKCTVLFADRRMNINPHPGRGRNLTEACAEFLRMNQVELGIELDYVNDRETAAA